MISIDLPALQSIQLGSDALAGTDDVSCELIMRSICMKWFAIIKCRSSEFKIAYISKFQFLSSFYSEIKKYILNVVFDIIQIFQIFRM